MHDERTVRKSENIYFKYVRRTINRERAKNNSE